MKSIRIQSTLLTMVSTLCLLFFCACESGVIAEFEENWHNYIGGTYPGQIMSEGVELSGKTFFEYTEDGLLTGHYEYYKNGDVIRGVLSNFKIEGFLKMKCRWKDPYGSGHLYMIFSEDLASFAGHWYLEGKRKAHRWNGARIETWD